MEASAADRSISGFAAADSLRKEPISGDVVIACRSGRSFGASVL